MLKFIVTRTLLIACLCSLSVSAYAVADGVKHPIDIPAENLSLALEQLSKQSGTDLVYRPEQVRGFSTRGLVGQYSAEEAVTKLLTGTPLTFSTDSSGALLIAAPLAGATTQASPGTGDGQPQDQPRSSLQLAQATPAEPQSNASVNGGSDQNASDEEKMKKKKEQLQEVVVTGSHIEGSSNPTAPVITITRDDIDKSGYTTTQQFVASIPQNFGGGTVAETEDGVLGGGALHSQNDNFSTGINLSGLGPTSTLPLLNGQRLAPSAEGIFVNVGVIPLAAIERIDILQDGDSAIYGSDAVAGVVNFITRKDYEGAESWANYGSDTSGDRRSVSAGQLVGAAWSGGGVFGALQYQDSSALTAADRSYTDTAVEPTDLLPQARQYSLVLDAHQDLPAGFEVLGDVLFSRTNNLGYTSQVDFEQISSTLNDAGVATASLVYRPSGQWHFSLNSSYSFSDTSVTQTSIQEPAYTQCNGGDICYIHDNYKLFSQELIADGTLFHAPAGDVKAAFGGDYRNESFADNVYNFSPGDASNSAYDRHVVAEFAELQIPVLSSIPGFPLIRDLNAALAVRHDYYSDFGDTTNPRYGISFRATDSVKFHGAYSTSFRAPSAFEQVNTLATPVAGEIYLPAPSGVGTVPVFLDQLANNRLGPERSRNWNGGFKVDAMNSRLSLSADYFDIRYRDRIIQPNLLNNAAVLSQPNVYGSLISQFPNDAAAQAFINQILAEGGLFFDLTCGSPTGCNGAKGVRYLLNNYEQNAALETVSGVNVAAGYRVLAGSNAIHFGLNVAYLAHMDTSYTANTIATDVVNTYNNPLHWRARGQVDLTRGPFSVAAIANFSGSYVDTTTLPYASIASWVTLDMTVAYHPLAFKNLQLTLAGSNLFNRDPPYVAGTYQLDSAIHYDVGQANAFGRVVTAGVRYDW